MFHSTPHPIPPTTPFARIGGRENLLKLLRAFYADVRQHQEIGPFFAKHVTDWPTHLDKIANFWSTILGGPPSYAGPLYHSHQAMQLAPEHYNAWLDLWTRHCHIQFPHALADELVAVANNIAVRLKS